MSPGTYRQFTPIQPTDRRSQCEACKAVPRRLHDQVAIPKRGEKRPRESEPGQLYKGAKNRVPPALAQHIGEAMLAAWQEEDAPAG